MKLTQVAAQLYTVRDHCQNARDLAATAHRLRGIGYGAVQLSGLGPIPETEVVAIMQGEGLVICATHEPSQRILDEPEWVIDQLQRLGCRLTAYPYPAGVDFADEAQVNVLVRKLDAAGARLRAAGLCLGYHNHALEFAPFRGATVLDYIYAQTKPENVVAELDTYWVRHGGGDVVAWVKRMRGRQPFIHLKDFRLTAAGQPMFCEIGAGTLPFREIIAEAEAGGCEWFIIEQDTCPGDPFDSLAQSFRYTRDHLVA